MSASASRRPVRHAAARSRVGVAVGSIAACVALTGGLALQHLGASNTASATTPTTTARNPYGSDDGFQTDPFADPNNGFSNGGGFTPNPGGANTTSQGS